MIGTQGVLVDFVNQDPPRGHHSELCCHCTAGRKAYRPHQDGMDLGGSLGIGNGVRVDIGGGDVPYGAELTFGEFIDAHSHLFPADLFDWIYSAGVMTRARIKWLAEDMAATGVHRMVISGMMDGSQSISLSWNRPMGDVGYEYELDELVMFAYGLHPTYFIPFARGFEFDNALLGSGGAAKRYARECLENGFAGLGELFIHGHGITVGALQFDSLVDVCRVAVEFDAPVLVHWEIGVVDPSDTPAADNYDQMIRLLDKPGLEDLKLIVAHCGVGKYDPGVFPYQLTDWETRITDLLARDNVYFDISGLQNPGFNSQLIDAKSLLLTPMANFLFPTMQAHSDRFFVGIDAESRPPFPDPTTGLMHAGMPDFLGGVAVYRNALSHWPFSPAELLRILHENLEGLLP